MRFITEFIFKFPYSHSDEIGRKLHYNGLLGNAIAEAFGWDEKGETTPDLNCPISHKHKLEIEAFPMDKWVEFKKRFMDALPDYDSTSRVRLINAIADLEKYGYE